MRRLSIFLLLTFCLVVAVPAQKKTNAQRRVTTTKSVQKKQPAKKQSAKKQPAKQQATKKQPAKTAQPVTVKGLQNQRQQLQQQMKEQERKLRQNEQDVKKRLQSLMIINTEINDKRRTIDTIRRDITTLDGNIQILDTQLKIWEKELSQSKDRYRKSVRYMHRNRNIQNQLMFVFSAKSFSQMYRRMRFMREYAVFQRAQGEAVQAMQRQVEEARGELSSAKKQKDDLLYRDVQAKKALEGKQVEQQSVVNSLQKQQKTLQTVLEQQRKKDAALNEQIDKLIAEEIARAKARAEAERKKAAAEEAARKKRESESARKKDAERKVPETKTAKTTERKTTEKTKSRTETTVAKKKAETDWSVSTEDRRLSGNFESNRGRFPMPITGPYKIVNTQGQHRVEGLKGTTVQDMKGIELKGQSGAQARCIFDGEVSRVEDYRGVAIVIVRHGTYFSVYSDLSSVSVSPGQKVSTRQVIGTVSRDGTMKFQMRRSSGALLNPLAWLSR